MANCSAIYLQKHCSLQILVGLGASVECSFALSRLVNQPFLLNFIYFYLFHYFIYFIYFILSFISLILLISFSVSFNPYVSGAQHLSIYRTLLCLYFYTFHFLCLFPFLLPFYLFTLFSLFILSFFYQFIYFFLMLWVLFVFLSPIHSFPPAAAHSFFAE